MKKKTKIILLIITIILIILAIWFGRNPSLLFACRDKWCEGFVIRNSDDCMMYVDSYYTVDSNIDTKKCDCWFDTGEFEDYDERFEIFVQPIWKCTYKD